MSNVDKKTVDGQQQVKLCNYTDVYYRDLITSNVDFMPATATAEQIRDFSICRGDVLITKDSESPDDIGIPAFVADDLEGVVCGYHLAIVRPDPICVHPKFLFWLLASNVSRSRLSSEANGITRFGLRAESFGNISVPVLPFATQSAIADYLDAETARIDALIARKRRMIELLEERRNTYVNATIARCGPLLPLRRVLVGIEQGWSPECEDRAALDGEWSVLKAGCVNGGAFNAAEHKTLPAHLVPRCGCPELTDIHDKG